MQTGKHECTLHTDSWISLYFRKNLFLYKWFILSETYAAESYCFRSKAAIKSEKKRQLSLPYFIIHPFSKFRVYWESLMICVYLIAFFFLPFEACHFCCAYFNKSKFVNYGIPLVLLHFIFIVDMILTFFTGYVQKMRKRVILKRTEIAWTYLKSYFIVDVLSTVPALTNAIPLYFINGKVVYARIIILNFIKLIKVITFLEYCDNLAVRNDVYGVHYKIFRSILITLFFFHWLACLLFVIPFTFVTITPLAFDSWIKLLRLESETEREILAFYFKSLLYTINLSLTCSSLIRSADTSLFVTSILYVILGVLYTCFLFVQILDIIRTIMEPETKYEEFMTQLGDYMRHKQLPANIQDRMRLFYEYRYQHTYFREEVILNTLSYNLCKEINYFRVRQMLSKVACFDNIPPDVLELIISDFTVKMYLPKDVILKHKTICPYMYFIESGTVAMYTGAGDEILHLYDGNYFGTVALLKKDRRTNVTVTAIEICEIYLLDIQVFFNTLAADQDALNVLLEEAKNRYKLVRATEALRSQTYGVLGMKLSEITL